MPLLVRNPSAHIRVPLYAVGLRPVVPIACCDRLSHMCGMLVAGSTGGGFMALKWVVRHRDSGAQRRVAAYLAANADHDHACAGRQLELLAGIWGDVDWPAEVAAVGGHAHG